MESILIAAICTLVIALGGYLIEDIIVSELPLELPLKDFISNYWVGFIVIFGVIYLVIK